MRHTCLHIERNVWRDNAVASPRNSTFEIERQPAHLQRWQVEMLALQSGNAQFANRGVALAISLAVTVSLICLLREASSVQPPAGKSASICATPRLIGEPNGCVTIFSTEAYSSDMQSEFALLPLMHGNGCVGSSVLPSGPVSFTILKWGRVGEIDGDRKLPLLVRNRSEEAVDFGVEQFATDGQIAGFIFFQSPGARGP